MTQLRTACKCGITNILDEWERGIGHRGSSFMDFDAVSHDGATGRWLVRELKQEREPLGAAEERALSALSRLPQFTVWYVQFLADEQAIWADLRMPSFVDRISRTAYRARLEAWWNNRYRLSDYLTHSPGVRP